MIKHMQARARVRCTQGDLKSSSLGEILNVELLKKNVLGKLIKRVAKIFQRKPRRQQRPEQMAQTCVHGNQGLNAANFSKRNGSLP